MIKRVLLTILLLHIICILKCGYSEVYAVTVTDKWQICADIEWAWIDNDYSYLGANFTQAEAEAGSSNFFSVNS